MHTKLGILFALLVLLVSVADAATNGDERALLAGLESSQMMQTVRDLCSPAMAGRQAGTQGDRMAAQYVGRQFQQIGLASLTGTKDFAQCFPMKFSLVGDMWSVKARLVLPAGAQSYSFSYPDYYGVGGVDRKAPVVFAGYGIITPKRDDYRGLDVKGKIVMLFRGTPKGFTAQPDARKIQVAYGQGAVGCILVGSDPKSVNWDEANYGLASPIADFPTIVTDRAVASRIMSSSGLSYASLEKSARLGMTLRGAISRTPVELQVPPVCDPTRPTQNMIAVLPGTDTALKSQYVLVSSHYDHLGLRGRYLYPGADDDASGVAVTLEIARALANAPVRPKRSVLFVVFGGEEGGLLGSTYFTEHLPVAQESITAALHMDMVGAGERGHFVATGGKNSPNAYQFVRESAADLGCDTSDVFKGASDNLSMTRKKLPAILISTGGRHPNYHLSSDVPEAIDPKLLQDTARLVALSTWRIANQ